jgi:hypothetical protein
MDDDDTAAAWHQLETELQAKENEEIDDDQWNDAIHKGRTKTCEVTRTNRKPGWRWQDDCGPEYFEWAWWANRNDRHGTR